MKKVISIIVVLAMLMGLGFSLAEGTDGKDYAGIWESGDDTMMIVYETGEDEYVVYIVRNDENGESTYWSYAGVLYDEVADDISCNEVGVRMDYNVTYNDGAAAFAFDGEGNLVWTDFKETPGENETVFTRADTGEDEGTLLQWFEDMVAEETVQAEGGLHASIQHVTDSPDWVKALPAAQEATQLFVVAGMGMDRTTATVSMHEKDENGDWKQILSTPGFVGRNGLCPDADHVEGCGQTPIGVYHFNKAFGIAADPGCALKYVQVDDDTYWSGDPDRQYNQMVDIRDVPDLVMDDSEHIVDYEYQYQYCLNISFNEDGTPGRGSAIFLHCLGPVKPYTGGCVAIPENLMKLVMQSVKEDCVVVIDTLENMNGSL